MPTRPLAACLAALDPDPSRAGFEFEQVAAWWLTADPVWASRTKRVWRWAEWPGRTSGQDLGIDLVAELVDGGLLAVQVKHRADVPTREIDSFLAAAAGGPFTERMLLATTDVLAVNGRKKLLAAGVHIVGRVDLERSPVSWPDGLDLAAAGREPARGVRPHQAAAVADTVAALEAGDRCRVVMACGTGKTLVAQRAAETVAGAGLVVVAVPSLSLLKQTLESWARDSLTVGGLADWLAVCSDRTVADAPDPSEMPTVTTDPAAATAWLSRRKSKSVQRVVFVTHASLPVLADALTAANRTADLLIVDEAHRVAGRGQLATLATGDGFRATKRVFLTATPRVYTAQAKSKADGDGVEIISMDDPARFGSEAHHLSFAKAVAAGLLCDFEIVVSIITDRDTARLVDRRVLAELDGVQSDAGTLAAHVALARALHDWDATRTISFHTRIAQAYSFAADHPRLAVLVNPDETVLAEATSGAVPAGARGAALDRLRDLTGADRRLLANARVLSEGVDVPSVDAVAFIDPRRSVIDIAQAVGRAMRTAPGKTRGLVIVPVHLPASADPDTVADATVWKPVWDTLRALRAIDERLAEELDQYRYQLGRRTGLAEPPTRLHFDSVEPLNVSFVEAVTTAAVRYTTASWEEWFGLLKLYAAENGHAVVPRERVTGGFKLGDWVSSQRSLCRSGRLSAERITRLEGVSGWTWDPVADEWERGFEALSRFVRREGDALVSEGTLESGFRLGQWVAAQRRYRRRGLLAPGRIARLEALTGWSWDPISDAWEQGFSVLVRYAQREGHVLMARDHVEDGFPLGAWVHRQRNRWVKGRVAADQQIRLEAIPGWSWSPTDDAWEQGMLHLARFAEREGHTRVPKSHREDGYRLGNWVSNLRSLYQQGRLPAERATDLESVRGWAWEAHQDAWEAAFGALAGYVDREGHARVPRDHQEGGFALGSWVASQRTQYKKSKLAGTRARRLEALPGWSWDTVADRWEGGYAALEEYVRRHGNARPGHELVQDGYRLGPWVMQQRTLHKAGRQSPVRWWGFEGDPRCVQPVMAGWSWSVSRGWSRRAIEVSER